MIRAKIKTNINCVDYAKKSIIKALKEFPYAVVGCSAGKDSTVLSHIIFELIDTGIIEPKKIIVHFFDEEGIYPDMRKQALWLKKQYELRGCVFDWICIPLVNTSVINVLDGNEEWTAWDPKEKENWIYEKPEFAIKSTNLNYCYHFEYSWKIASALKGCNINGIRISESVFRANVLQEKGRGTKISPIKYFKDGDIWLYIAEHNLSFPEIYIRLYENGCHKSNLRLCNFFGDSSIVGMKYLYSTDFELWKRIEKRFPNAYMGMLYLDTSLFKRTSKRKELKEKNDGIDYKKKVIELVNGDMGQLGKKTKAILKQKRANILIKLGDVSNQEAKSLYIGLCSGDPKGRAIRKFLTVG